MTKLCFVIFLVIPFCTMAQYKPVSSGVYHLADIAAVKSTDREGRRFLEGATPQFDYLEIHASTQYKGALPRPAHAQTDIEELIFVKEGTMKFTMGTESKVLPKGSIILIPPHEMQALQNVGDGSLTYYVFMFRSKKPMDLDRSAKAGGPLMLSADSLKYIRSAIGGGIRYFSKPTAQFGNLEMHITELKGKGQSHAPHSHAETELILMLEGKTEIMIAGKIYHALAGDICLINSNEFHGISNSQDTPCMYAAIKMRD